MDLNALASKLIEESKIDEFCLDVLFVDIASNSEKFKKFHLSGHILNAIKKYGVEKLHTLMSEKLAESRAKGKHSWWKKHCTIELLSSLLSKQLNDKVDVDDIDVCNFTMFIYFKGFKND